MGLQTKHASLCADFDELRRRYYELDARAVGFHTRAKQAEADLARVRVELEAAEARIAELEEEADGGG